jgi:hypothetical protein
VNARQKRTLEAVFADPVSGTIKWAALESLLEAVGCRTIEGKGSRVKFEMNGILASFHRPHPEPNAKHYQVRDAREFLTRLGVKP